MARNRCLLANGRCVVVFNGEIYNHLELRAQLESLGCVFQSDHSDTEILLHGYRLWGEKIIPMLNGMWAFALWDAEKKRLFISRDRKKPLFWFNSRGTFAFASELTALLEHPNCRGVSRRKRCKSFRLCPRAGALLAD